MLSRTYAARTGAHVDPNQEMVGLGAANLAAGFFQGFPISSSSSRTPVAEAAGARTQLAGVVGALTVSMRRGQPAQHFKLTDLQCVRVKVAFWTTTFLEFVGEAIFGMALLCVSSYRRQLVETTPPR